MNPSNPKLYEICGSASLMLKNFNEALEYFQRSMQLNKGLTNLIVANLMSHGASFVDDHSDYEVINYMKIILNNYKMKFLARSVFRKFLFVEK